MAVHFLKIARISIDWGVALYAHDSVPNQEAGMSPFLSILKLFKSLMNVVMRYYARELHLYPKSV